MPKILVIHGAGMNMRGKVQLDVFGPMTLPEYDERIRGYAKELGVEVEIFHSNVEGEIVNKLYAANDAGVDAAIFNRRRSAVATRRWSRPSPRSSSPRPRCTSRTRSAARRPHRPPR